MRYVLQLIRFNEPYLNRMETKYVLNRCLLILTKNIICINIIRFHRFLEIYCIEDKGEVELFFSLSFKRFPLLNNDATPRFFNFHDIPRLVGLN